MVFSVEAVTKERDNGWETWNHGDESEINGLVYSRPVALDVDHTTFLLFQPSHIIMTQGLTPCRPREEEAERIGLVSPEWANHIYALQL